MPPQNNVPGTSRTLDVIDRILRSGEGAEVATRTGMKTTNVVGYPLMTCWARWGGSEPNQSGNLKAILFLPYVQSGLVSLIKPSGGSSMESPVDMVSANVPNPYNIKASINPFLNISALQDGEYYSFILAIKPGAFTQGGNTLAYWDAWIMRVDADCQEAYRPYLALLQSTLKFWEKLKATVTQHIHGSNSFPLPPPLHDVKGDTDNHPPN
jgi:hypothetical protein